MSRVSQNKLVCSMTEAIKVGLWRSQRPNISFPIIYSGILVTAHAGAGGFDVPGVVELD